MKHKDDDLASDANFYADVQEQEDGGEDLNEINLTDFICRYYHQPEPFLHHVRSVKITIGYCNPRRSKTAFQQPTVRRRLRHQTYSKGRSSECGGSGATPWWTELASPISILDWEYPATGRTLLLGPTPARH